MSASKINSRIVRFQNERGGGSPDGLSGSSMDIAYVSYRYGNIEYEVPIQDAWLFEYEDTGNVIPILVNHMHPDIAIANSFFTFWMRVQVIIIFLLGGLSLVGISNIYNAMKTKK